MKNKPYHCSGVCDACGGIDVRFSTGMSDHLATAQVKHVNESWAKYEGIVDNIKVHCVVKEVRLEESVQHA